MQIDDYCKIESERAKITGLLDFSGYNSITCDNSKYYKWSHYRPQVSKLIEAKLFNDEKIKVPDDFGIYVNKNNIKEHIGDLEFQKTKHISNYI